MSSESPLLLSSDEETDVDPEVKLAMGKGHSKKDYSALLQHESRLEQRKSRLQRVALGAKIAVYLLGIGTQTFAGVKVLLFDYDAEVHKQNEWIYIVLFALPILWGNILLQLLPAIFTDWMTTGGLMEPSVHPHRLFWETGNKGYWCDLCRKRGTEVKGFWNCSKCSFDICKGCLKKKEEGKARGEGQVRGDKGVREQKTVSTWSLLYRTLKLAAKSWGTLLVGFLCLLATAGATLLLPKYQGDILNSVANGDQTAFLEQVKWFIVFSVAVGIFGGVSGVCFNVVGRKLEAETSKKLFGVLLAQDIAFFDGSSTGGAFMCFSTEWRLAILATTVVGPILTLTKEYAVWSKRISQQIWSKRAEANAVAVQALTNIRTVRAFGQEPVERRKQAELINSSLAFGIRDAYTGALTSFLTRNLDLLATVLILWYGGWLALVGDEDGSEPTLDVGSLIKFQLYWNQMTNAYQGLANILTDFTRAAGAAQRVMELMDSQPDIDQEAGRLVEPDKMRGELRLQDVEFHYQLRPENPVLRKISLSVPSGKVLALVGRSGGGKSTLVHLLMRFYDPKRGSISLDGTNLIDVCPRSLHQSIGLVAQDTELFQSTIEDNISYGVADCSAEDIYEAARKANAHEFIMSFEEGYQTRVGDRGMRLSGGQKQRIAIARVMLRKPKLLFLDEATSSLDTESEALVQAALDHLIAEGGCTIVLVAHRLSTVVNADSIAVIDQGRILEQGTHEELLKHTGGIYAKLVSRQLTQQQNILNQDGIDEIEGKEESKRQQKSRKMATGAKKKDELDDIDSLLEALDQANGEAQECENEKEP